MDYCYPPPTQNTKADEEGLTASKFLLIEDLALFTKVLVILLQDTQCSSAYKLVIPNLTLSGSITCRKRDFGTFVNNRYCCSLADCFLIFQRPSDCAWTLMNSNTLTSTSLPSSQLTATFISEFDPLYETMGCCVGYHDCDSKKKITCELQLFIDDGNN